MATTIIRARQATLKFATSAVTFATTTALNANSYGALTVVSAKNLTLSKPKSDPEMVVLLGETAVTIGSNVPRSGTFQNAVMDEKAYTVATLKGTAILRGDEDFELLATGTGTATTGALTRYSYGDSTATTGARNITNAILIDLYNGTKRFSAVMVKSRVNIGDIKPTGTDGHWEVDFELTCLPEDYADEFLD